MNTKKKKSNIYELEMRIADLMNTIYTIQSIAKSGMLFRSKEASECIHEIALLKLIEHGPNQ